MSGGIDNIKEDQILHKNITSFKCSFLTGKDNKKEKCGYY